MQTGCEPRIRIDLYTCCSISIYLNAATLDRRGITRLYVISLITKSEQQIQKGRFLDASLFYCTATELLGRDSQKKQLSKWRQTTLSYSPARFATTQVYRIDLSHGKVWTLPSRLLAFRTVTTSVSTSPYSGLYTEHKGEFNATVNILTYLLTPWSRVLLEKLTSKLCS